MTQAASNAVVVQSGARHHVIDLEEGEVLTVGDVRTRLADVINVAPNALAVIFDETVDDERILQPGEILQFIKQAGKKG